MSITPASRAHGPVLRTTVSVPRDLVEFIDRLVGERQFTSRNSVVELALRRLAWDFDDEDMFEAFAEAAKDPDWVAEANALAEEAVGSGWEVIQLGDAQDGES